ncbi:MAG: polysaccharide deacetylase [Acidobacteria bacterium]|nr:polysaccharide deacetylase [Acidobacteriota bacterium]
MRLILLLSVAIFAQPRKVVLSIDDLPRGGDNRNANSIEDVTAMTKKLVGHLKGTNAIGFVNSGRLPELGEKGLQDVLKIWVDGGLDLGNHTYSHPDISGVTTPEYCADIARAEPAIQKALNGRKPLYFRHPFLRTGKTKEAKEGHEECLRRMGYEIAPVTLDNSDYVFAAVYGRGDDAMKARVKREYIDFMDRIFAFFEGRSLEVFGRPISHVLLLHANQLNADTMPELLAMMRKRGYEFVSLKEAMADPAYRTADNHLGQYGPSWLHRWAATKGVPKKFEPDEPAWIMEEFKKLQAR